MDQQLVAHRLGGMFHPKGPVNIADDIDEKEGDHKSGGVVVIGPDGDEDGVEGDHERELPGDPADNEGLPAGGGELIDDGAK